MLRCGIGLGAVLGLFLMLVPASAVSILQDFHHRRWTRGEGLPDTRVHCLVQSRDGYLWIGTRSGLVRFDGLTFSTYTRANTGLLERDLIIDAVLNRNGEPLFRQENQVLVGWRGVGLERGPELEWSSAFSRYARDPRWTGSHSIQVNPTATRLRWSRWDPFIGVAHGAGRHADVFESSLGIVHIAAEGALIRTNPATGWHDSHPMPRHGGGWDYDAVFGEDIHRQMWVRWTDRLHSKAQLYRIDVEGPIPVGEVTEANSGRPEFLMAARDGSLWQPAGTSGLERVRRGHVVHYEMPWGREQDWALCMMEDREGHLWVGSEEYGLHCLRPRRVQVITEAQGLPTASVRSVAAFGNQLWIGTDSGGARLEKGRVAETEFTSEIPRGMGRRVLASDAGSSAGPGVAGRNEFLTYAGDRVVPWVGPFEPGSTRPRSVRALLPMSLSECWLGSDRGLFRDAGGAWVPEPVPMVPDGFDRDSLQTRKFRAMCRDQTGGMWMATAGYLIHRPAARSGAESFRIYGIHGSAPTSVMTDRAGRIWVGTDGAGIGRFDPGVVSRFGAAAHVKDRGGVPLLSSMKEVEWWNGTNGLSSDHVWEMFQDSFGAIWIVAENGLNRLPPDPHWSPPKADSSGSDRPASIPRGSHSDGDRPVLEGSRVRAFVFRDELGPFHSGIHSLIEDDLGQMWFGTDQGLFHVALSHLVAVAEGRTNRVQPEVFLEADGLPSIEVGDRLSHPSACKTADGRLWFATSKGLAGIDPRGLERRDGAPLTAIEEFRADDISEFATGPGGRIPVWEPIPGQAPGEPGRLRLAAGRARLVEFRYTAPHFAAPEVCHFQYRLDGYDAPAVWHDAGLRRSAYFTNLDPGQYRFQVQAANPHGVWSLEPAVFSFILEPHYWQTWTFRIGVLLGSVMLIAGCVLLRVREIRRLDQLKHEKSLLSERLDLARDLHDIVGAQFTELIRLGDLAGRLPPEQAVPQQRRMSELARELFQSVRHSMWATTPDADNLPALVDYLEVATRRLLSSAGMALVLDLPDSIPLIPLSPAQRRHVFLAAQEAVNNAVKHSEAKRLTIRLRLESGAFVLEIEDDGRGLPAEILKRLEDGTGARHRVTGGQGLRNIRRRMEEAGGTCEFVCGSAGSGFRVRFRVPMGGWVKN